MGLLSRASVRSGRRTTAAHGGTRSELPDDPLASRPGLSKNRSLRFGDQRGREGRESVGRESADARRAGPYVRKGGKGGGCAETARRSHRTGPAKIRRASGLCRNPPRLG